MEEVTRLSRLTAILLKFQSKRIVTISEIAKTFEISTRTAYRDLKALEQAGVPILKAEERGYSLIEGFNLPPIMFTTNEINTFITLEKVIQASTDSSLIENYQNILTKIKAILNYSEKEKVELLSDRIGTTKKTINQIKSNCLLAVQTSITEKIIIEIQYTSLNKAQLTKREIQPLGLYFANEYWVVIAWCTLRNELREFRLDRILTLKSLGKHFENHDFILADYFIQVSAKNKLNT